MKLNIVGASNFVNRMFEACGNYQWARELLKNALEAGAKKVEFGIEWQAVEKHAAYRRIVADDGAGMSPQELLRFFSTLGEGAKKIGGVHDNFGVGAKIATLPWNPEGVVVMSYKRSQASMIWIYLEGDTSEYELVEFDTDAGTKCVIDPTEIAWPKDDIDWSAVKPEWIKDHGTVVVLLGSKEYPDTILGNPGAGETDIKGLSVYLNTRFWDLSSKEIKVVELRSEKKNSWPQGPTDRDDARRPNNRQIMGARHYLVEVTSQSGKLIAHDVLAIDDGRVTAEWFLWEGERPAIHSYAKKGGYIAVRYGDELFQLSSGKVQFRSFGVVESQVQQNLTIILEPERYEPGGSKWGIYADQSRNRLIFTGHGEKGVELPILDWGIEFAENMPEPVMDAIRKARGKLTGSIEDEDYRKRLQDKFGSRWTMKVLVKKSPERTPNGDVPVTETDEDIDIFPDGDTHGRKRKKRKKLKVFRKKAIRGGPEQGEEREAPVDVPRFRYANKDEFDRPWHLAAWVPHDPSGPTVVLNNDSPILEDVIKYHQEQYAPVHEEEVAKIVRQVFGEVAVSKVAHSQKLSKQVAQEELDANYRSEPALTIALMGLLAEESLISQRLGKLGRKRPVVEVAAS